MTLFELLHQTATSALGLQDTSTGSMPAGHNGPYHDPELPVRNTAHWLITFLKAYELSGDRQFCDAAQRAVDYLMGSDVRPHGKTFWHRTKSGKDRCNGLIGQAWTIEALVAAAETLNIPTLDRLAEEVFLMHPFDEQLGIWQRVEVDGTVLPFDMTLNHQLWFAASGALVALRGQAEVGRRVRRFLDVLVHRLKTFPCGLVWHPLSIEDGLRDRIMGSLRRVKLQLKPRNDLFYKSIGYHSFNLYGLAILKLHYPAHSFWESSRFKAIYRYAVARSYSLALETNKYGYPYNPPGIEMAFGLEVFCPGERQQMQERWLSEQINRCYDVGSGMMCLNTDDPLTHSARIYEATRLPDLVIAF